MKHKHCDVIKAWADGTEVQWKDRASDTWIDWKSTYCPGFDMNTDYRVKPEKKQLWARPYTNKDVFPAVLWAGHKELLDECPKGIWIGPAVLVWKES